MDIKYKQSEKNKKKVLSVETKHWLSYWRSLYDSVSSQIEIMEETSNNSEIIENIEKLCGIVRRLYNGSDSIDVHLFGSRVYGLATNMSDVDLYVEIGGTFNGEMSDNIDEQVLLVKSFGERCFSMENEFKDVEIICNSRVPIVKFRHIPTQLDCDLSFKDGMCLYNSKLLKTYLSMDRTVKWLACFVISWAQQNELRNKSFIFGYAFVWLMLFYLMTEKVVPPLHELMKNATSEDRRIIEGWLCTSGKWSGGIESQNLRKLMLGFFQFYADKKKLRDNVLCTYTGRWMSKEDFFRNFTVQPEITEVQRAKFKTKRLDIQNNFETYPGLAIQNPFRLSLNMTREIVDDKLTDFCELCDQTAELLKNPKCRYEELYP